MKKLVTLLLIITTIITVSCKDAPIDPCVDSICSCDDTIYYTKIIYLDTFVMMDAEYIYPNYEPGDSLPYTSLDSFRHGDFYITHEANNGLYLLDENNNISFTYLGGVRGTYEPHVDLQVDPIYSCDPSNSVFIAKDTIYHYYKQPIPFAILETRIGTEIYIDTAFYPIKYSQYHHQFYAKDVLSEIIYDFTKNGLYTDSIKFNKYLNNFHNIGNTGHYLVDIFPSEGYRNDGAIEITLFKDN